MPTSTALPYRLGERVADMRTGKEGTIVEISISLDHVPCYRVELDASEDETGFPVDVDLRLTERRLRPATPDCDAPRTGLAG